VLPWIAQRVNQPLKGTMVSRGYFVWNDLMTPDPAFAVQFYTSLLGWNIEERDMGSGNYTMFKVDETYIGGASANQDGHPHWVSYISVEDINRACEQIRQLGGTILQEPFTVEGIGTMAYAADPNGAVFSPFQDENPDYQPELPEGVQPAGAIAWHEVSTDDQNKTDDFYSAIFGWNKIVWPMEDGEYHGLAIDDSPVAGVFKRPDNVPVRAWTIYFEAPGEIDQVTADVRRLGGSILRDKFTVAGTGDIAVVADPAGAVFGLMKSLPMNQ
jgi:uncharacterized protein